VSADGHASAPLSGAAATVPLTGAGGNVVNVAELEWKLTCLSSPEPQNFLTRSSNAKDFFHRGISRTSRARA
jgi:hypothetical protein